MLIFSFIIGFNYISYMFFSSSLSLSLFFFQSILSVSSHVILPKELAKMLPKGKLLSDAEWRAYGVQQSRGWEHYAVHKPEPHILLFRRMLGTDPTTGKVCSSLDIHIYIFYFLLNIFIILLYILSITFYLRLILHYVNKQFKSIDVNLD